MRVLFASIGEDVVDLCDRALLSLVLDTFARVEVVVKLDGAPLRGGDPPSSVSSPASRGDGCVPGGLMLSGRAVLTHQASRRG